MHTTPKVSIVIPVYNVEDYLCQCLDSVIHQTLPELEIICVNDGSTDRSAEILLQYAQRDSRIQIICQENGGLSVARNTGAQAATGTYLYFLDSDDYLELNAMECLYSKAEADSLEFLYFERTLVYEGDPTDYSKRVVIHRTQHYDGICTGQEMFIRMFPNGDLRVAAWEHFIRRDYYIKHNLMFAAGLYHEDILFSMQCLIPAQRVGHCYSTLYNYRARKTSITNMEKNIRHVYGLLYSVVAYRNILWENQFSPEFETQLINRITDLEITVRKTYLKLSKEEQQKASQFRGLEKNTLDHILKEHRLSKKVKTLTEKNVTASAQVESLTKKLDSVQQQVKELTSKIKKSEHALACIRRSTSFRIGRCLTWLPRKLRDLFKK